MCKYPECKQFQTTKGMSSTPKKMKNTLLSFEVFLEIEEKVEERVRNAEEKAKQAEMQAEFVNMRAQFLFICTVLMFFYIIY